VAVKVKVHKCQICGCRPASSERGFCKQCEAQLEAAKHRKQAPKAFRYLTYRGVTIEFLNGKGDKLTPQLITRNPETLPKRLLINLDTYCPGFTREQIKKMKRLCLSFAQ
jgi:hypothetical protein